MKAQNFKMALVGLMISGLVSFGAANSFAVETGTLTAPVVILETLQIASATNMDFGTVEKPATGSVEVVLSAAGGGTGDQTTGSANEIVAGSVGSTNISGTNGQSFNISGTPGICSQDPALTLGAISFSTGPNNISFTTDPFITTQHAATLTIDSSVNLGLATTCPYTITAIYN